jgi:hypothetical protein
MKKLLMILPLVFLLCFAFGCQKAEEVAAEKGYQGIWIESIVSWDRLLHHLSPICVWLLKAKP